MPQVELNATNVATRDPEVIKRDMLKKEAALNVAFKSPMGIRKVAASLVNPVRKYLDHVPIGRKLFVAEPMAEGMIAWYNPDIEEFSGMMIGQDGASRFVVCASENTIVTPFEISAPAKIPYRELRLRKFRVVDRVKERVRQALGIEEDYRIIALLHDASVILNTEHSVATKLTKNALAAGARKLESPYPRRMFAAGFIMNWDAIYNIRLWEKEYVDEIARIEIRRTGFLGTLFGAGFYVTNLISTSGGYCYLYIVAPPQFLGWMPIYASGEIIPADLPDQKLVGFDGYELLGAEVINNYGVARVKFMPDA
jgi:hypothetical protein